MTLIDLMPRLSFTSTWNAINVRVVPPFDGGEIVGGDVVGGVAADRSLASVQAVAASERAGKSRKTCGRPDASDMNVYAHLMPTS